MISLNLSYQEREHLLELMTEYAASLNPLANQCEDKEEKRAKVIDPKERRISRLLSEMELISGQYLRTITIEERKMMEDFYGKLGHKIAVNILEEVRAA